MGKKGFYFLLLLALLLAGISIFLVKRLMETSAPPPAPVVQTVQPNTDMEKVLVAKDDIAMGKPIGSLDVDTVEIPKAAVAPTALKSPDELTGRFAAQFIPKGDIILQSKAVPPSQLPRASLIVEQGHRLVSVRVDEIKANGFLVKNGDYVDLVGTFAVPDELVKKDKPMNGTLPVTFMQRVKVFDIVYGNDAGGTGQPKGNGTNPDNTAGDHRLAKGTTATFDVTPRDAETILAGESKAAGLTLVLRRLDDEEIIPPPNEMCVGIIASLTGLNYKKEEAAPPPPTTAPPSRKKVL